MHLEHLVTKNRCQVVEKVQQKTNSQAASERDSGGAGVLVLTGTGEQEEGGK